MERVVEECLGCGKREGNFCTIYKIPAAKWRNQNCPMATHLIKKKQEKDKINPIKKSKRLGR